MGFAVKHCPFCAEEILADARRCTQCGHNLAFASLRLVLPWKLIALLAIIVVFVGDDLKRILVKHMDAQVARATEAGSAPSSPVAVERVPSGIERSHIDAALAEVTRRAHRIHDFGCLLPLTGADGTMSRLGTTLSLIAMERAAYLPEMRLRVSPSLGAIFQEEGFFEPDAKLTDEKILRVRDIFWGFPVIRGNLLVTGDVYHVVLKGDDPGGASNASHDFSRDTIHEAPEWIALELHRMLGISLTPEETGFLSKRELVDARSLFTLAELEPVRLEQGVRAEEYRALHEKNPDSASIAVRLLWAAQNPESEVSGESERIGSRFERHGAIEFELARRLLDQPHLGVPRFLALLPTQHRNGWVYANLTEALRSEGKGDLALRLLDAWVEREPGKGQPLAVRGEFHQDWAWDARGEGWGSSVTPDGRRLFEERIQASIRDLVASHALYPRSRDVCRMMIVNCMASGSARSEMETWFEKGKALGPIDYPLHTAKLEFLNPKWRGSDEQMLEFARACAKDPVEGSELPFLLYKAHEQLAGKFEVLGNGTFAQYFRQDTVYPELKAMFEELIARNSWVGYLNRYARVSFDANDYTTTHLLFQKIGDRWSDGVWASDQEFLHLRSICETEFANGRIYKKYRIEPTTAITPKMDPVYLRNLSIFYSSFVNPAMHDAVKALKYGTMLNEQCPDWPIFVETLACAHARAGDFTQAVALQKKAIQLLKDSKDYDETSKSCGLPAFESKLAGFEAGQPYEGEQ